MASGPITSWEIDGETVETVADFISWVRVGRNMESHLDLVYHSVGCLILFYILGAKSLFHFTQAQTPEAKSPYSVSSDDCGSSSYILSSNETPI